LFELSSDVGNYITISKEEYSYFAGNNYLGLANNSNLKAAAISAIDKYGINFSASRATTGTSDLHVELERLLAEFKNQESSVVFASGYLGNRIMLSALQEKYSAVFADESAHPSIIEGIPSDISKVFFYNHYDTTHLETLLEKNQKYTPLIITDGLFALTGEIAPLDKINSLAEHFGACLVVDDAHATGILGRNGRGTPEYFQIETCDHLFQTETMSKALGAYGGFISASKEIIAKIWQKSSAYIGSTSLPPPLAAAGCASIKMVQAHPELRSRLDYNAALIRNGVTALGYSTSEHKTPIIPILLNSQENAEKISNFLKENHIIAPFIKYPVKSDKYIVRITVSAIHTEEQIEKLLQLLEKWRNSHGIN